MPTTRAAYLAVLCTATTVTVETDADAALDAFLSLNAGYFLGEWLPDEAHHRLVSRLARRLDGLNGLAVPDDETTALQLAQHVRELAASFGPTPWTERISAATAHLVPTCRPKQPEQMAAALRSIAVGRDGDLLVCLHAERRLWALTHPEDAADRPFPAPAWALALALDAAASADGRAVQVAEAALAELTYGA